MNAKPTRIVWVTCLAASISATVAGCGDGASEVELLEGSGREASTLDGSLDDVELDVPDSIPPTRSRSSRSPSPTSS